MAAAGRWGMAEFRELGRRPSILKDNSLPVMNTRFCRVLVSAMGGPDVRDFLQPEFAGSDPLKMWTPIYAGGELSLAGAEKTADVRH
jgi:hypothetical protein